MSEHAALPARRRFRLSVRILMLLVLVLGGGLGWLAYSVRVQRAAVAAIREAGGQVYYGSTYRFGQTAPPAPPRWTWLRSKLGEDLFDSPTAVFFANSPNAPDIDAVLPDIGRLNGLEAINFEGVGLTDRGLEHLRGLRRLKFLAINSPGVKGPGLANLAGMTRLVDLNLRTIPVHDADVAFLANLKSLERLLLVGGDLTDEGMRPMRGLASLQVLQMPGPSRITEAGLAHLSGLTKLRYINLAESRIASLGPLAGMTGLTSLILSRNPIDDAGLAPVAGLTNLSELHLDGTRITDAGLPHLKGLASLKILDLDGTRITDAGLPSIVGLTGAVGLNLGNTGITYAGLVRTWGFSGLNSMGSRLAVSPAVLVYPNAIQAIHYFLLVDLPPTASTIADLSRLAQAVRLIATGTNDTPTAAAFAGTIPAAMSLLP